jgi:hypothetical protein
VSTLVIQYPVRDFQAWKNAFDSDPAGRAKNLRSRLGTEQFQAGILDEIERVDC